MRFFNEHIYNRISFFLILIYVIFLNWSPFINAFMIYAMSGFLLLRAILIKPHHLPFLKRFDFYLFSFPVFLYGIGLLYADVPYWREFSIVLPLLGFAAVFTSNKPLTQLQLRQILWSFSLSTALCALVNFSVYFFVNNAYRDIREMSLFMSHIRFSLFVNIAIFSALYYLFLSKCASMTSLMRTLFLVVLAVLIPYLFIQQSLSGIVSFTAAVLYINYKSINVLRANKQAKILFRTIFALIFIFACSFVYEAYSFVFPKDNHAGLAEYTVNGNPYTHQNGPIENGHYVFFNISDVELQSQWQTRSVIPLYGNDEKGQNIYFTLIRYLTSRNLTKDSVGLSLLSANDISFIEKGETNYRFTNELQPNKKIYTLLWELHSSYIGSNPAGHSATQRLVFIEAALKQVHDYPWFGSGTSQPTQVLRPYYESMGGVLPQTMWYGPHNQYMSFAVMFGLVGLGLILLSYVLLAWRTKAFNSYFKGIYFIIIAVSMLVEDSISTQAGVVLYGLFGGLFLFGSEEETHLEK